MELSFPFGANLTTSEMMSCFDQMTILSILSTLSTLSFSVGDLRGTDDE